MAERPTERPESLLLVHGAGSGPWVYEDWNETFPGTTVVAVDLQENLDANRASHTDYAANVIRAVSSLPQPVSLCGWSMGGLVVLQAADRVGPHSVILLEASPPAEVQGFNSNAELSDGTFDPEAVYGPFPSGMQARPESSRARAERKRGISVPTLPCPSLVIYGDTFRTERGKPIAHLYGSDELDFPGLDHWDLVRNERVRIAIARWLGLDPPPELHIRLAMPTDVDALHAILVDCGLDLRDRLGKTYWIPAYPRPLFEEQIAKGNVYAVETSDGSNPVATFTISEDSPSYFDLSLWSSKGEPALYVTRLAVTPSLQGRGIGTQCVAAIERIAAEGNRRSVRFDAVAAHTRLSNYYQALGYRVVGRYEAFGTELVSFEKPLTRGGR